MPRTLIEQLNSRWSDIKTERSSYIDHYRELQQYIMPRRGRFFDQGHDKGSKSKFNSIIDNSGTLAARTLASGMMSGLTSPARPWFRLTTPDPDLAEFGAVKQWLADVERLLFEIFAKSNVYNTLANVYREIGVFGTAPAGLISNFDDVVRGIPFTVGSYGLAINDELRVDTVYREIPMTVKMIVDQFGLDNVSRSVRNLYNNGTYGNLGDSLKVMHAIEPNIGDFAGDESVKRFPFRSVYWELGADANDQKFLAMEGFNEFPILAPRWDVLGTDVYGSSPGMEALGDVRQLQVEQKWKGEGIAKQVKPPLKAPEELRDKAKSTTPGGITYYNSAQGVDGISPLYQVNFQLGALMEDIQDTRRRISRAFYEDLFLMLANTDRRQITAREVEERHEEKLLMLGPVLERLEDELLDPLVSRTFNMALEADIVPEVPAELSDVELKVEYISVLAQAQKAVSINTLERTAGFIGNLAQLQAGGGGRPDVLDKFDFDQAADEYGEAIGISPSVLRTDDQVNAEREARAQAEQAAQQQQMMQQALDSAQQASQIPTDERNALTDSMNALQGDAPPVGQP